MLGPIGSTFTNLDQLLPCSTASPTASPLPCRYRQRDQRCSSRHPSRPQYGPSVSVVAKNANTELGSCGSDWPVRTMIDASVIGTMATVPATIAPGFVFARG